MLLNLLKKKEKAKIFEIKAEKRIKTKLASMGLVVGSEIIIIRNDASGPVILAIKGNRLILGKGIAKKIFVEKIS